MKINIPKSINSPWVEPLYNTWGSKSQAGNWSIILSHDFSKASVKERNSWYADVMMSTVDAFASLARVYQVSFGSIPSAETNVDGVLLEWKLGEPYDSFLEKAFKAIQEYSVDIYALTLQVDLFVYVHTKESPDKHVHAWVREFGNSMEMGEFEIFLDHPRYKENYVYFDINHMLFYPESWNHHEDNIELFNLNRPLLEGALRNWEQKFDAEIEVDGLPGIYKYGFLPEEEWNKS
jgi:hypothetical protein